LMYGRLKDSEIKELREKGFCTTEIHRLLQRGIDKTKAINDITLADLNKDNLDDCLQYCINYIGRFELRPNGSKDTLDLVIQLSSILKNIQCKLERRMNNGQRNRWVGEND